MTQRLVIFIAVVDRDGAPDILLARGRPSALHLPRSSLLSLLGEDLVYTVGEIALASNIRVLALGSVGVVVILEAPGDLLAQGWLVLFVDADPLLCSGVMALVVCIVIVMCKHSNMILAYLGFRGRSRRTAVLLIV